MKPDLAQTITVKIEATIPLPQTQDNSPVPPPCSAGCGNCGKTQTPLMDAGETLLDMASKSYSLDQLSRMLEFIELLLKKHYSSK